MNPLINKPMKKFTIYGERCSGTNFIETAITENFHAQVTYEYGSKHFFCFNDLNKINNDNIIVIGIVRNPIYWLNSFSKELHHIPKINKSLRNFLFNEFYSINELNILNDTNKIPMLNSLPSNRDNHNINHNDLNYFTGNKYKNIFELRKLKNDFLMNIMPTFAKNYILINYESLLYNYQDTMNMIKEKMNFSQRFDEYKLVKQYKKSDSYNFVQQRLITFKPELISIIWNNLDKEQEETLGYVENDDNNNFKNNIVV